MYDVIIIGSGPAGLTAAIYTTRGAAKTLILGGEIWGGQLMLTTQVDNFPGFPDGVMGPDLMTRMKQQAEKHGAEFRLEKVVSCDFSGEEKIVKTGVSEYQAKSVIVATGALTMWLGVKGEKELIGRGVSSCAPCDAPFFKEKVVAVVGGGDSAMEEASFLSKFATKIYLIHRRDEFRASAVMQERVKNNPKIEIVWNSVVTEVKGPDKVTGIKIKNVTTNEEKELTLDGVFVAIGHKPDSDIFEGVLPRDEKGFIQASVPGVFVAGDVSDDKYKQAITAAGFGCQAAMDALKYLEEKG